MTIRTFQPGDEIAQVGIYNEAGADLPKFKPATLDDLRRRCRGADFDAKTRFYAVEGKTLVGYSGFQTNGRVSYPWCRKGHEQHAEPLLRSVFEAMHARGISRAFAAYRGDWPEQEVFFLEHGFRKTREMVNFVLAMAEMPTPAARRTSTIVPLTPRDIPEILTLSPGPLRTQGTLRTGSAAELQKHLFENPYFSSKSLFGYREPGLGMLTAVAIIVYAPGYADPRQVDSAMPCFRLGAFGTEGMQVKRINGLFSFLARPAEAARVGLDLLTHAAILLRETPIDTFAAQVSSDIPHLLRFYEHHFRKQASFPVLEREL